MGNKRIGNHLLEMRNDDDIYWGSGVRVLANITRIKRLRRHPL